MLKTVEGIYAQGEIKLQEKPDNIPPQTQVIVTFLNESQSDYVQETNKLLTNEEIEQILQIYRQENKSRPAGLCKGDFVVSDDFNAPLPDEILDLIDVLLNLRLREIQRQKNSLL